MGDSFTHLHVHTEFSMLDGAARVDDLVAKAVADGQPALGITDHGNMYGILDFYKACKKHGIKPILGTEAYMAHDTRLERPSRRGKLDDSGGDTGEGRKLYYHLTLLAENGTGYRNLIQLASRSFLEGYYYKPRVDWELLEEHHEGVIATSGCLGGHVLQALVPAAIMEPDRFRDNPSLSDPISEEERFKTAVELVGRFQDIFGRDNFFIEIQDHGIGAQEWANPRLIEIADKVRAPLLATNDSHYTEQKHHKAHDALLCVQTGSLMSDPKRFKFTGTEHYLKTAAEMRRLFREIEVSCDNSLWIAERAEVEIEFGQPQLPDFPLPPGFDTADSLLENLTFVGAKARWGDPLPDAVVERLAYELKVISDMGFSSYFLITGDLIDYARREGIRVGPGRGSAAGCAVAYCLRITDLDPIEYDLLFERFLNPSRISMPDIDMDFDSRGRDEMIRYAAERYGRDHVAQIVTFSTIKARAAVRDAARVLGEEYSVGDRIAKAMPPLVMGRDTPLWACFEPDEKYEDGYNAAVELRDLHDHGDPKTGLTAESVQNVVDVARGLEGLRRGDGIHAAAVVITKEPLTAYVPIQRKPESGQAVEDAPVVTQYEMNGVESLGLLKMDFLGLRNLDVISDTLVMVERIRGITVDIDHVPLDDEPTYELLREGSSIGVFQLEGGPMRALMRSLAPTSFEDVAALVALYRPGPMAANMHNDYADRKNGRQPVEYLHPDAEEILADTWGLMIYQESVMRIAQKFAGYSLADADNLRKACGKKIRAMIAKERSSFVAGCESTGYGAELGEKWFDIIEPFADYAFNKSHSYGYGYIAYQTAFLKANYGVEYLAALLTSVKAKLEKAAIYLNECRVMGIDVVVPDVNRAMVDFWPAKDDDGTESIVFGMSAVRNVGVALVHLIVAERDANGPFVDFYDFCNRVDLAVLNKRTVESLIHAGAFDSLGHPRRGLLTVFEQIVDRAVARRRREAEGQFELFSLLDSVDAAAGDAEPEIPIPDLEFAKKERLAFEKEMLGLYVSDHPLRGVEGALARRTDTSIASLIEARDEGPRVIGGVVTNLQRKYTRKGDLMAIFELEDLETSIEAMVFPRTMQECGQLLDDDTIIAVRGRLDTRDDTPKFIVQSIERLELQTDASSTLRLRIPVEQVTEPVIDRLRATLRKHPGRAPVYLHLDSAQILRLSDEFCVDTGRGLLAEIRELLGYDSILAWSADASCDPRQSPLD